MWHTRVLYADYSAQFTGTTNVWRRNKLQLYPGSGSTYASAYARYDGHHVGRKAITVRHPVDREASIVTFERLDEGFADTT
jgi:hypothetical protein